MLESNHYRIGMGLKEVKLDLFWAKIVDIAIYIFNQSHESFVADDF